MGNAGCPLHPQPRVRSGSKAHELVTTVAPGSPGIPARNGFNGFLRALPGDRAFLSPSPAEASSADLTPASRRQDHTTSPSARSALLVCSAARVHRIPSRVRDDRETPLCVGRDGEGYRSDLGPTRSEIFLQGGLDKLKQELAADFARRPPSAMAATMLNPTCAESHPDHRQIKALAKKLALQFFADWDQAVCSRTGKCCSARRMRFGRTMPRRLRRAACAGSGWVTQRRRIWPRSAVGRTTSWD